MLVSAGPPGARSQLAQENPELLQAPPVVGQVGRELEPLLSRKLPEDITFLT